jgi:hypothetical protein
MADISSPKLLYLKGLLFLITGLMAGGLLLLDSLSVRTAILLILTVWCFARAYYFAFYVVHHYIDDSYRFAGLWDFFVWSWNNRKRLKADSTEDTARS